MELLNQGRKVAGLDLNAEQLTELETIAAEAGHSVITCQVDITQTDKLTETLDQLAQEHGGIGILVNNAGITRDRLMIQMDEDDFDKVIAVNLKAAFVATRIAARSMIRNKFGRLVHISSVAGVMGQAGSANYAASKAGLIGMSKSGFIMTEMTEVLPDVVKTEAKKVVPMKRFGKPEEIARAVAFLASDDAGYITGQVLCVDGGMAM
jgi:3-oxoacyl-[acyl-carrier protein] reductase